jgi:hypothetical protein
MIERISPLNMGLEPEHVIDRNGWKIPLTYVGERMLSSLFVTDLSHVPKWSLQGSNLDNEEPAGLKMPRKPGSVTMDRGLLLVRLIPSEARIMVFGNETPVFEEAHYTDITDGYASIAVVGPRCFDVLSKLSAVDMEGPTSPRAALAPIEDVTCLVIRLEGKDGTTGLIITVARGYGHFLQDAFLDAGKEYGIQPAGRQRFDTWYGGA